MNTAVPEQFCIDHSGMSYNAIRQQIQKIDFHDCYPEVDRNGKLTGECIPGDASGYRICDIGSEGIIRVHEHAVEAMIKCGNTVTIAADHENNAELFWQNLSEQFPEVAEQLQDGAVQVDSETWAQMQQIAGFADGPSHAPNAVVEWAGQPPFLTAADLQTYVDANGGKGLIVFSDGLSVAFGDENHSPTEAEFEPLQSITQAGVDRLIVDWAAVVN